MKIKAFAIIDTNVIISSLISKEGFTNDTLDLVNKNNIIPIFDKRILREYFDVTQYEKFKSDYFKMPKFSQENVYDVLYDVIKNGLFINEVNKVIDDFKDSKDIPFFEVKMSSEELDFYLVTGNIKHFPNSDTVVTPKEMIGIMKYLEKFVLNNIDYDIAVKKVMDKYIHRGKYTHGTELLNQIFDESTKTIKYGFFR